MVYWFERVLREEQDKIDDLKKGMSSTELENLSRNTAPLFPQMSGRRNSNMPSGLSVPQALLGCMSRPCLDISPVSEKRFHKDYSVTVEDATELARRGLLLCSGYVTQPEKWEGYESYRPLLKHGIVNRLRTQAIWELIEPSFSQIVDGRATQLKAALKRHGVPVDKQLLRAAYLGTDATPDDLFLVIGTRWAYLDALGNDGASERVARHFAENELTSAFDYLRGTTYGRASEIAGSYGGDLLLGTKETKLLKAADEEAAETTQVDREGIKFLLSELLKIKPLGLPVRTRVDALIEFLERPDFVEISTRIRETCLALAEAAIALRRGSGNYSLLELSCQEYGDAIEGYRRSLKAWEDKVKAASVFMGGSTGTALGFLAGGPGVRGAVATILLAGVGAVAGLAIDEVFMRGLRAAVSPRAIRRAVVSIEKLKQPA